MLQTSESRGLRLADRARSVRVALDLEKVALRPHSLITGARRQQVRVHAWGGVAPRQRRLAQDRRQFICLAIFLFALVFAAPVHVVHVIFARRAGASPELAQRCWGVFNRSLQPAAAARLATKPTARHSAVMLMARPPAATAPAAAA